MDRYSRHTSYNTYHELFRAEVGKGGIKGLRHWFYDASSLLCCFGPGFVMWLHVSFLVCQPSLAWTLKLTGLLHSYLYATS